MTDSIPARLLERAARRPHLPAYHVREGGIWRATSYETYADEMLRAARALVSLGFEPGQNVAILGFNRPEWTILDLATMAAGGAPAGIYTTCSPEEVQYIIDHSESPIVLVENEHQWEKVKAQRANLPGLRHVITMRGTKRIDDPMVMGWDAFLAKAADTPESVVRERIAALEPNALATMIYTSGTTGPPKGVMLSHANLTWTADVAVRLVDYRSSDCSLSYLPLSHIAEQMFSLHGPITSGASIYFARSIDDVPEDLKEVQPTIFFGVPRIWEKFHAGVSAKLAQAEGPKAKIASWALDVGREAMAARATGRKLGRRLRLKHRIADKVIYSKVKPAIGLGRARVCVTGAAPISREVLEFFAGLDLLVLEVYGQSEGTGPTSFNQPDQFRYGTVGPAIPGAQVRIAEDGEILLKGPNVFLGYYKNEEATKETLDDEGWLHSGDLGAFDGPFLKIVGRKKEIIITAGGKNIAPKNLEAAFKDSEFVNECVVIGDERKFLSALVTLDPEAAERFAAAHGEDASALHESAAMRAELQKHLDAMNAKFARVEQIKKFTVLPRNLTVEEGELTPTLKVKRRNVAKNWATTIDAMYA
ncbi:MAG: long-chain fatty acid--CoA ligase [Myxococcota bacterium]